MTPQLIVRRLAENQLVEAFYWYEERALGLGAEFLRAFELVCAQIERQRLSAPTIISISAGCCFGNFRMGCFM